MVAWPSAMVDMYSLVIKNNKWLLTKSAPPDDKELLNPIQCHLIPFNTTQEVWPAKTLFLIINGSPKFHLLQNIYICNNTILVINGSPKFHLLQNITVQYDLFHVNL